MFSTLLLSLAPVWGPLAQEPAPSEAPAGEARELETNVWAGGGVEAPRQPMLESSSNYFRTDRYSPQTPADPNLQATRTPITSLVSVRGMEENHVMGIGLVTGLAGSGDSSSSAKMLLQNLLLTRNINVDLAALASKNIAVVRVEAVLPAGIRAGQRIDVRASTIGDATSLQGGTLAMTELTDISGRHVFVTASGPVTVGGFSVGGENATATQNHVTVGTLPGGGKIERAVETSIVSDHGYLYLDLRAAHDTLGNVVHITEAINALYPGVAVPAADGKSVHVRVPEDLPEQDHVAFAHSILSREVRAENVARVIINERSGVIVMGGDVRLQPGVITHGNLTVTIAETTETSQPGPFSNGSSQNQGRTQLDVVEEDNALILAPGATTLQEVVDVLNVLGTTPRDMITILQAMSQSGTLLAEIRRM